MTIFKTILSLFKHKTSQISLEVPDSYCPNCWGRQEYEGRVYEALKTEGIDVNSASAKKGWVQEYADKHLGQIRLSANEEGMVCQKCKVSYRKS